MNTPTAHRGFAARKAIAAWLLIVCALIFAMVVLGGVTRLTGSGLSMVEWEPIVGILPPLNQAEWNEALEMYRQSPEYHKINQGMDLAGFKGIFWLEYAHRVLGRLIGIAFLIPLLVFLVRRQIPGRLTPQLVAMFVLGGLQGLMGWYMVKSGLVDNPHVSQYRLTAHLLLAMLIYGYMLWVALGLFLERAAPQAALGRLKVGSYLVLALTVLTMASGGFVAGLKAGMVYNTFPLMGGHLIPQDLLPLEPWPRNLFENVTTVQFDHRLLAVMTFISIVLLWLAARRHALPMPLRYGLHGLLLAGVVQVALGISTLLLQVPIALAAAHQAGAMTVFTLAVFVAHRARPLSAVEREAPMAARQPA
jgi:cytochrome c oxidase assembly protein subunit 15